MLLIKVILGFYCLYTCTYANVCTNVYTYTNASNECSINFILSILDSYLTLSMVILMQML